MTDYEEEQKNEIEAIESIYPEEFSTVSEGKPHCFQISIEMSCQDKEDNTEITVSVLLQFTFVETYPDEAPLIEILSPEGLRDEDITELEELLIQEAEENLGMVMVFTLVSYTQEKLQEFLEGIKWRKEEERIRLRKEAEEEEKKKFTGTPVTKETFIIWRETFDLKMAEKNKGTTVIVTKGKVTGRKLFEEDDSMKDSDSAFLEGGDVEVDESLFQELDGLELDDQELS